jgi:hypothetical protein
VLIKNLGICSLLHSRVFLPRILADNPEIQTGEGHAVGDLQSAIAFTAHVTREYFARHYPGDLDNYINHAIVARHILSRSRSRQRSSVAMRAGSTAPAPMIR